MKIFRYEDPKDKGGPYFNLKGECRENPKIICDDSYVHGCISLKTLKEYFKNSHFNLNKYILKIYDIPDNEVLIQERQVIFPKKYIIRD